MRERPPVERRTQPGGPAAVRSAEIAKPQRMREQQDRWIDRACAQLAVAKPFGIQGELQLVQPILYIDWMGKELAPVRRLLIEDWVGELISDDVVGEECKVGNIPGPYKMSFFVPPGAEGDHQREDPAEHQGGQDDEVLRGRYPSPQREALPWSRRSVEALSSGSPVTICFSSDKRYLSPRRLIIC